MTGSKSMQVGRAAIAAIVTAAIVAATGCSDTRGDRREGVATPDPALTFAPFVSVHPREPWLPIAADAMIARSALRWRDGDCGDDLVAKPADLDPARLGGAPPYVHRPGRPPDCRPAKRFTTSDYTRPYDPLRPNDIAPDEGFYLDLDDSERRTTPDREVDVPVYFEPNRERRHGRSLLRITYWLLFRFDQLPGPASATALAAHEGDWERLSVLLRPAGARRYVPLSVRYGGKDSQSVPWRSVRRVNGVGESPTHPVAFAVRGSHLLRPRPGRETLDQTPIGTPGERQEHVRLYEDARACPDCHAWRTWRDLRRARDQPWYGYGGGWGDQLGDGAAPSGLGPSRWVDVEPFELG